MGYINKALSLVAFVVFGWYMWNITRVALSLFYPAAHIPVLKPLPKLPAGTKYHRMSWREPFEYEASVYMSELDTFFPNTDEFFSNSQLVWRVGPQSLSQRHARFDTHLSIRLPETFRKTNGTSLYAFLFIQKAGQSDPHPDLYDPNTVFARTQLTSIRPHVFDRKHALLGSKGESKEGREEKEAHHAELEAGPWVPHAKSRVHWEIVLEDHEFAQWTFPMDLAPYIRINKFDKKSDSPYVPITWENPLAVRSEHWVALTNHTAVSEDTPLDAQSIDVDMSLSGVILGWFRLCNHANNGINELGSSRSLFQFSETDLDGVREMVYEVNPLMLGITIAAMAMHMLFEFLAYKEDVSFWSQKSESNWQGISRSSMLMSVASSWISFMYLWDRKNETNVVVLIGTGVGALVEAWKLTRLLDMRASLFGWSSKKADMATAKKEQAEKQAAADRKLKQPAAEEGIRARVQREVDQLTTHYMVRTCIPAMAAYAAFSLVFLQHESYVSWFLNVSLATVYSLEFIQMWPQLLINHKLKTVDMLPLTAFLYRFLVTFIDDLYALVVPMPLIARIGTLRDDVVFFVLCYQWYKFPRRPASKGGEADAGKLKTE
ncbi:Cleft lip and palate associated transmembrane protein 1 [Dipsacomyces acuminosporus]|nr:Cleft lip and palate associated transmembrane protein 1 [Dipsacomyces acuminosporus]